MWDVLTSITGNRPFVQKLNQANSNEEKQGPALPRLVSELNSMATTGLASEKDRDLEIYLWRYRYKISPWPM